MQLQTLQQQLTQRAIVLYVNEQGKLSYNAPKGTMTPELMQGIKEHRAALLSSLQTPVSTSTGTGATTPGLRAMRSDRFRPCKAELALWSTYYGSCPWYKNLLNDGPWGLALEYATDEHIGSCLVLSTNKLIRFYEECQPLDITTEQGRQSIEPRQYTQMLYQAYQDRNIPGVLALASAFTSNTAHIERQLQSMWHQLPSEQSQSSTPAPVTTTLAQPEKPRKRTSIYASIATGEVVTDNEQHIPCTPECTLSELVQALAPHLAQKTTLYICGELPQSYESWLTDAAMLASYKTGQRGHYFDTEKHENHVARYQHRETGHELDIRTMYSWYGDSQYTPAQALRAVQLLNSYLSKVFTPHTRCYATPALTFQRVWQEDNRIQKKEFKPLPADIRDTIRSSSGQGRIEMCTLDSLDKIDGLYYYDGIFMYSSLTWGMPGDVVAHDELNEYAGKVPARYRIRYTIPADWAHVGLFMTAKDQVTGRAEDNTEWCYPGEDYQGRTFETWADGSELDVAYNLPDGMPAWSIEILERIIFAVDPNKPLDSITNKLVKMREQVEQDARQVDTEQGILYVLVRGAIRNILLHGIGSFNRKARNVTYILTPDEPVPDNYIDWRVLDDGRNIFTVRQETEAYTQEFEHPEYCALIWARCRARMTKATLSLPREQVVAIRTDAIAVTKKQPQWENNTKRGQLRRKWAIEKKIKAPHTYEQLDKVAAAS